MPPIPLSPEEEARIAAYYSGGAEGPPAPAPYGPPAPFGPPAPAPVQVPLGPAAPPVGVLAPPASPFAGAHVAGRSERMFDVPTDEFANIRGAQTAQGQGQAEPSLAAPAPPGAPPPASPVGPPRTPVGVLAPAVPPSDDEQFRAFVQSLEAKKPAPVAHGGGAPAKPANPDPYGIGAAQRGQMHAFDDRMGAMDRAADANSARAVQVADGQRDLARMQDEDAAIARAESEYANKQFADGMAEIGRELDDVRAKKIDPLRTIKESPALGIVAVLGSALSGFYQGITKGAQNEFLADLDRQIDRGYAEDLRQVNDKKFALEGATNLLQQARSAHKDEQIAEMQYRNLTYEAAKLNIASEAEKGSALVDRAAASAHIAEIELAQQELAEKIGTRRQQLAASQASQAFAQAKEVRDYRAKVYENLVKEGYSPAQAETESRRQVAIQYGVGVGPRPAGEDMSQPVMTREHRSKQAAELHDTTNEAMGILSAIRSFDPKKVAAGSVYGSLAPNALMSDGQKAERDDRERYASLVRPAVGAAWRLQTHGVEPKNPHLLDEQAKAFMPSPSDNDEDAARKMKNLEQHMINAAKSGGVELPDARPSHEVVKNLGARPVK